MASDNPKVIKRRKEQKERQQAAKDRREVAKANKAKGGATPANRTGDTIASTKVSREQYDRVKSSLGFGGGSGGQTEEDKALAKKASPKEDFGQKKEAPKIEDINREEIETPGNIQLSDPSANVQQLVGAPTIGDQPEPIQALQKGLAAIAITGGNPEVLGVLGKAAGPILSTTGKSIIAGLAGASGIYTWLASDNIISGMNIFTRDLRNAVTFGQTTPEEALAQMEEAQETVDGARSFIDTQTAINPLLWAFRGIIMSNADAAQRVLDFNKEQVGGVIVEDAQPTGTTKIDPNDLPQSL